MRVLGIDQSYTSTGYCIIDDRMIIDCGVLTSDKTKNVFERSYDISYALLNIATEFHPKMIGVEGLAFNMRGNATRDLAGLQFVIMIQLQYKTSIPVEIVNPKIVKKFATGNGNASKDDLYNSTPSLTKLYFEEKGLKKTKGRPDVVDAYWIATYLYEKQHADL